MELISGRHNRWPVNVAQSLTEEKKMNKLRLELDDLRVDTFSTSPSADEAGGTVRGHDDPSFFQPCQSYNVPCEVDYTDGCPPATMAATCAGTCASCNSCYYSCVTCWNSCAPTCDPCYPIE